ncbi:hypothetical protein BN1232_00112 [Mycobacterium lentiflavum]|uniref:Uncharacterized protein n=1 Tax=Mycobacterium lentiflavum TaxID=141349 RepID=A0A0E3WAW5_MYCLN|nr:hypothetical protein BN1232_00112 [Mycobacterium lentiflavum]
MPPVLRAGMRAGDPGRHTGTALGPTEFARYK